MSQYRLLIPAIREAQKERRRAGVRRTSKEVYEKLEASGVFEKQRGRVYQFLFWTGPLTSSEIIAELEKRRHSRVVVPQTRVRLHELRKMGAVRELGEAKCSVTGSNVILWDVTDREPGPLPTRVTGLTKNQLMDRVVELEDEVDRLKARSHKNVVVGIDEAGVGCLAGPMVIVAAAFRPHADFPELVRDSKKLSAEQRESLIDEIYELADWVMIKVVTSLKINLSDNIWTAWTEVMGDVLTYAKERADKVIVDGNRMVFPHKVNYVVKADDKHREVSAASIVAKYVQTEAMVDLHELYPKYGFRQHNGYGTAVHLCALEKYGPTPHHRAGYRPVKEVLTPGIRLQMMQANLFEKPVTTKVVDRRS